MSRVLITGSADGLGLMAGAILARQGHAVTLHARKDQRADDARRALPEAETVVIGDVSTIAGIRQVAAAANATGRYDAVIHNVGISYREPRRIRTEDGLEHVFAVNVLAPYLLTALVTPPARLVYLSSEAARIGVGCHGRRFGRSSQRWVVHARRIRLHTVMMVSVRSKRRR